MLGCGSTGHRDASILGRHYRDGKVPFSLKWYRVFRGVGQLKDLPSLGIAIAGGSGKRSHNRTETHLSLLQDDANEGY